MCGVDGDGCDIESSSLLNVFKSMIVSWCAVTSQVLGGVCSSSISDEFRPLCMSSATRLLAYDVEANSISILQTSVMILGLFIVSPS